MSLLTPAEVADRLNASKRTVQRLIVRGELPAIKLNARSIRVAEADLDAFLAARRSVSV